MGHSTEDNVYNGYCLSHLINIQARKQIQRKAGRITRYNVSQSILQSIDVRIPSLPEQEKIANFLSTQDELIEKEEEKLNLLKEQKKGLLQQMFV